jgi:hypothetical protein
MDARQWLAVGGALVLGGILVYLRLFFAHEGAFVGQKFTEVLYNLASHVPDDNRSAGLHILAGVMLTCGIAFVAAGAVITMPFVATDMANNSLLLTATGLVFGMEISVLSFWTLWQTRRIEQNQGSDISSFPALIIALNQEIERLLADLRAHNFSARSYHRIYLITTNPFFGKLSFPTDEFTIDFENTLLKAAKWVAECKNAGGSTQMDFQILCGDNCALEQFHRAFYRNGTSGDAEADPRAVEATRSAAMLLEEMVKRAGGSPILHRVKGIPKMQFAVVGNTVFEFILDNPGFQSEIHRARRIREKVMCDRFVETFQILKELP